MPVFDTFQTYLLVVNLSALLLNTWHFYLRSRDGRDHVSDAVRIMLLVAGGAAGSLLPMIVWDHRTKKDNALLHVLTLALLVIWGVAYAFIYVCPPDPAAFMDKLLVRRDALCIYLGTASLVTLVTFGADKLCAIRQRSRIPRPCCLVSPCSVAVRAAFWACCSFVTRFARPSLPGGCRWYSRLSCCWLHT